MDELPAIADRLCAEIAAAIPGWVEARIHGLAASEVVIDVEALVMPDLRAALRRDVDEPGPSPLAIVRRAVGPMTELLQSAGIPPPPRDAQQEALFPDDTYDLVPASFADLSPAAGEAGIAWGAARAFTHLQRHRTR